MDSLEVEHLRQQIVQIAQGLPVWIKLLRWFCLAAAALLAIQIWRGSVIGSVRANIAIFFGGLVVVAWVNIEIWVFAGRLDLIGLLPFIPLIYIGAKTISDRWR